MRSGELAIIGGKLFTPFETIDRGTVTIKNGKIVSVGHEDEVSVPSGAEVIDATNKIVAPGFINIHIIGSRGVDTMDATYDAINEVSKYIAGGGETSFVPSTVSAPQERIVAVGRAVKSAVEKGTDGAEVLGLHLEGPFINPKRKGSHNAEYIRPPSIEELDEAVREAGGYVKLVTIAPELEGALDLIRELKKQGIVSTVGHSDATYGEMMAGVKAGLSHATHMFDGMRPFHHREPGVVGAILTLDEMTADVIADGVHVHPAAIKILIRIKGTDKVALITDATKPAGMPDGMYELGGLKVIVKGGVCRTEAGNLAGSIIRLNDAVRNMVDLVGLSLQEAIKMATINPAKVIGVDGRKGSLEPGKDAGIVIFDNNMNVYKTIVGGKIVYDRCKP